MKACVLRSPSRVELRPLEFSNVEKPSPRAHELLVRVRACGVCRTDLHVVEGDLPERVAHVIPGHQVVAEVVQAGKEVQTWKRGARVGIPWLRRTCGLCRFCVTGRENLCERAEFNGWSANGGFAEWMTAPADFVYQLPDQFKDLQAAPLLCAGVIGYRSLRLTGIAKQDWAGARLGIYGFGAAGHVVIQIARARGADVYVCTRDREKHQQLAGELGAAWVGDATDAPPVKLDASIIFAPTGELVPPALAALDKGGVLVLGGIHMSAIPEFDYSLLYHERVVRSVANNTRDDGREFLAEAAEVPVRTHVQQFALAEANEALIALKNDAIKGAAVLVVD